MKMSEEIKALRGMNEQELTEKLNSARQELFNLRFQHATAQLEKTASIPAKKKEIARILTIMSEKGIKA
jgi:large subunit ribosomal protein L29